MPKEYFTCIAATWSKSVKSPFIVTTKSSPHRSLGGGKVPLPLKIPAFNFVFSDDHVPSANVSSHTSLFIFNLHSSPRRSMFLPLF